MDTNNYNICTVTTTDAEDVRLELGDDSVMTVGYALNHIDELNPRVLFSMYSKAKNALVNRCFDTIGNNIDPHVEGVDDYFVCSFEGKKKSGEDMPFVGLDDDGLCIEIAFDTINIFDRLSDEGRSVDTVIPIDWLSKDFKIDEYLSKRGLNDRQIRRYKSEMKYHYEGWDRYDMKTLKEQHEAISRMNEEIQSRTGHANEGDDGQERSQ